MTQDFVSESYADVLEQLSKYQELVECIKKKVEETQYIFASVKEKKIVLSEEDAKKLNIEFCVLMNGVRLLEQNIGYYKLIKMSLENFDSGVETIQDLKNKVKKDSENIVSKKEINLRLNGTNFWIE